MKNHRSEMLRLEHFARSKPNSAPRPKAGLQTLAAHYHTAALLEAIKEAIGNYAECETGHREYFCGRPHSAGCKHT
jgi:hypothetical protein